MADLKISQLTGATTPLAGTEVVPIVQSNTTKKVAVSDLTAGRAVSAAQLDVDNIRLDGNVISSTNTNGNITLTPNGTGTVVSSSNMTINIIGAGIGKIGDINSTYFSSGGGNSLQTGAVQNDIFGRLTGYQISTGSRICAFGYSSLYNNTTGSFNAAFGTNSLFSNVTGGYNASVGAEALYSATGSYNTAIGYTAGNTATTGSNNAFFGYNAQPSSATVSNEYTYGNSNVTKHRFPGGDIVIGTSGKGIDFSAAGNAAGMTSELLADYEEGTWTPVDSSGAGLTLSSASGKYTKIGNAVTFAGTFLMPSNADGSNMAIGGLPFTATTNSAVAMLQSTSTAGDMASIPNGTSLLFFYTTSLTRRTNAQYSSASVYLGGVYFA